MVQGISFDGLASGLDTDDMIQQLMEVERISVRRKEVRKQEAEAEQQIWQEVNQQLQGFDSSLDSLRQRETFESREVSSEMEDVMTGSAERGAPETQFEMHVEQLARAHRVASDHPTDIGGDEELDSFSTMEELGVLDEDTTATIDLGLESMENEDMAEITVAHDDSLQDIAAEINNITEETGVEASIMNDTLILNSAETGAENQIYVDDGDDTILGDLGITNGDEETDFANELQQAQDASFEVDGLSVTRSYNTGIDDVIEGVTLDLHGTNAHEDERFNLEVRNDEEQTVEAVSSFVEEYNNIQTFIREYTGEEDLLQGDVTMRRLSTNLRRQVTNEVPVDGELTNVGDLGIQVDDEGVMTLDETQLRDAISEDPEGVQKVFQARESEDGADGVARRVRDRVQEYIRFSGTLNRKDRSLTNQINRIDDRIDRQERRLERREERLRNRFTRMETTLDEIQAQGSWLQGQLQNMDTSLMG